MADRPPEASVFPGPWILHPYAPGVRNEDQVPCWDALAVIDKALSVPVFHVSCSGDYDYANALSAIVQTVHCVIVVEQDIVPTVAQVVELTVCPEPFCAFDYRLANGELWSEVADHSCLGLSRSRSEAWAKCPARPAVPVCHWRDLAGDVGKRLGLAHLHTPPADHRHDNL